MNSVRIGSTLIVPGVMDHPIDAIPVLFSIFITVLLAWHIIKWKLTYWDRIGLPTLNPSIPWGDGKLLYFKKRSFAEQFQDYHNKFKGKGLKYGGIYIGVKPYCVVVEPEIVKNIIQKDFQYFVNHGDYVDAEKNPLNGHLFNLQNEKWKNMRMKLTAAFSSGKIKMMMETLIGCTLSLTTALDECVSHKKPFEMKEMLTRFTIDFVTSVGFGIESNSLQNNKSEFMEYTKKVFEFNWSHEMKALLISGLPYVIGTLTELKVNDANVENFFIETVGNVMTYREKNNVHRNDFVQLLLELKNKGYIAEDDKTDRGTTMREGLELKELAAQAFVFFVGGSETSATTMTFALFALAMNVGIQEKLRREILFNLDMCNGQITYDGINKMTYLDMVLYETLRKYPPVPALMRQCSKNYTIPGSQINIEKGTNIVISLTGMHHDPEYYPDPDKFDPERFSEENKNTRPACTYIPFGEGPRLCIGMRLGLLVSKVGIAVLLKNYRISVNEKTKRPTTFDTRSFITSVDGGVWLDFQKISL